MCLDTVLSTLVRTVNMSSKPLLSRSFATAAAEHKQIQTKLVMIPQQITRTVCWTDWSSLVGNGVWVKRKVRGSNILYRMNNSNEKLCDIDNEIFHQVHLRCI